MIDDSELEKAIRILNNRWLQSDRKNRWMLLDEGGVLYIKRNVWIAATKKKTLQRLSSLEQLPNIELEAERLAGDEARDIV